MIRCSNTLWIAEQTSEKYALYSICDFFAKLSVYADKTSEIKNVRINFLTF